MLNDDSIDRSVIIARATPATEAEIMDAITLTSILGAGFGI